MVRQALNPAELREHIDWELDYLFSRWRDVAEVACEWSAWDGIEKEVYQLEWAIPRSHLHELESHVEAGVLSERQMDRYRDLQALMAELGPTLERMFAEE